MSWTQVHVSGLPQTAEPGDDAIEQMLEQRYSISSFDWAGEGSTLVKRQDGKCRGYCFLSFLTLNGATAAVEHINDSELSDALKAELSKPKGKAKKEKKEDLGDTRDLRLRRQRGQPVRKHPCLQSSNMSKLARSTAIHAARGPGS
jgi:RNA recognition motif-containing protein